MARILLTLAALALAGGALAAERYSLCFSLYQDGHRLGGGFTPVGAERAVWRRGLQRSYVTLSCRDTGDGVERQLSTVNHFAGLRVSHRRVDDRIQIHLERTEVVPRTREIRALKKGVCRELAPEVRRFEAQLEIPVGEAGTQHRDLGDGYELVYSVTEAR